MSRFWKLHRSREDFSVFLRGNDAAISYLAMITRDGLNLLVLPDKILQTKSMQKIQSGVSCQRPRILWSTLRSTTLRRELNQPTTQGNAIRDLARTHFNF